MLRPLTPRLAAGGAEAPSTWEEKTKGRTGAGPAQRQGCGQLQARAGAPRWSRGLGGGMEMLDPGQKGRCEGGGHLTLLGGGGRVLGSEPGTWMHREPHVPHHIWFPLLHAHNPLSPQPPGPVLAHSLGSGESWKRKGAGGRPLPTRLGAPGGVGGWGFRGSCLWRGGAGDIGVYKERPAPVPAQSRIVPKSHIARHDDVKTQFQRGKGSQWLQKGRR